MPTTDLDNLRDDVKAAVREGNRSDSVDMADTDYNKFILSAMRRYSMDRPNYKVVDITGTSVKYIDRDGLTGWVAGFSVIDHIEAIAPTVADEEPPVPLERVQWRWYQTTSKNYIFLVDHEPTASEKIRVRFSILHTIEGLESATATTIPTHHREAIIAYAVYRSFLALAGKFADTQDATIRLDITNYRTKSGESLRMADKWLDLYKSLLSGPVKAATVTVDNDVSFPEGYGFITHKSGYR